MIKGQLPRALGNLGQDPAQRHVLFDQIAPWLVLKLRCLELIAKCSEAAMENGMRSMSLDQERALDIILRTYEGQVNDLELQAVTGIPSLGFCERIIPNWACEQTMKDSISLCAGWPFKPCISTKFRHLSLVAVILSCWPLHAV